MSRITFALAKGRLAKKTLEILDKLDIRPVDMTDESRKLVFNSSDDKYSFFLSKPSDVPTFVDYGVADIGIVGYDTILEEDRDLYECLDLNIELNGSVELGAVIGLADCIVDIVESGKTLVENGLEVIEDVCDLSARVIVNKVSIKTKYEEISKILKEMEENL